MRHKTESRKKPQMCCEIKHNAGGKACHWQLACIYTLHCKADGWKEWIKTRWREERCEEELNGNGNVSRWLTDRMKRWLVPIEASNASQFCFDKENAWCLWGAISSSMEKFHHVYSACNNYSYNFYIFHSSYCMTHI